MGKVCELCANRNAEEKIDGVNLCSNCIVNVKRMFLDDMNAIHTLSNAANYPNASENAIKNIINIARSRLDQRPIDFSSLKRSSQYSTDSGNAIQQRNNLTTFNEKAEKKPADVLKYQKVLSTDEKRDWIANYIGIKKFVAVIYALIGLVVGILVARFFQYGVFGHILCSLIGCGIASALGTNAVGSAMMEAITAEQNIIMEELLTKLLNNSSKE